MFKLAAFKGKLRCFLNFQILNDFFHKHASFMKLWRVKLALTQSKDRFNSFLKVTAKAI